MLGVGYLHRWAATLYYRASSYTRILSPKWEYSTIRDNSEGEIIMRPRKPTNLKILEGTFRKDRAANEPKPVPIAPPKPAWLKCAAGEIWKQLAPDLDAVGCLTRVDGPAFALLVDPEDIR